MHNQARRQNQIDKEFITTPSNDSTKTSIFLCSAFFMVQLSHPYMTNGKNIALTRQTFVGKVLPLLFNMLSQFVMAFLPRSNHHVQQTETLRCQSLWQREG